MSTKVLGFSVLLAAASLAAGCGKSDDDGRARYQSGVSDSEQVSTLAPDERREICRSFDAYVNTYVSLDAVAYVACLPAAIWTTTTRAACESSLAQCMAVFPKPIQVSARAQSDLTCFQNLAQCQATVAELESCVNVHVDLALAIAETWSCARAEDPEMREQAKPMSELVNVCVDVDDSCDRFADITGPD